MDDYVAKPIRAKELSQKFAAVVGQSRSSPPADTTAPPTADRLLDWSDALELVEGDEELLRELIAAFLRDAPQRMAAIEQAVGSHDGAALRQAAHSLKGSMQAIGARAPAQLAWQLETIAANAQWANVDTALASLTQTMTLLLPMLNKRSQPDGTSPP